MYHVEQLITRINKIEGSSYYPIKESWINDVEKQYPGRPEDLKELYRKLGYGRIGKSCYSIHMLLEPCEIFGEATSGSLEGIYIVGDDFAGNCAAYDAKRGWIFGNIGSDGIFEASNWFPGLIEFLSAWMNDASASR